MSSTTLFSKTPPVKLFFLASIPGMISMLASSLYQTFDGILVGQFLGATAFAALNLAMPFVVINFAISDMIGVGSAVPISVCLGKKQNQEANNIFTCSILMIIGGSIITGAIIFAAAPLFIGLMGAEGDFADFAIQYLRVYALCSPFTTIDMQWITICGFQVIFVAAWVLISSCPYSLLDLGCCSWACFVGIFGPLLWVLAAVCLFVRSWPFLHLSEGKQCCIFANRSFH